jgi:hypothetical protein
MIDQGIIGGALQICGEMGDEVRHTIGIDDLQAQKCLAMRIRLVGCASRAT